LSKNVNEVIFCQFSVDPCFSITNTSSGSNRIKISALLIQG